MADLSGMAERLAPEIEILAVRIGPDSIQIEYVDQRDVSPKVSDFRSRQIAIDAFPEVVDELLTLLRQLVADAEVVLRNPPRSFTRPR